MDEVMILVGEAGPQAGQVALPVCTAPAAAAALVTAILVLLVIALLGASVEEGPRR